MNNLYNKSNISLYIKETTILLLYKAALYGLTAVGTVYFISCFRMHVWIGIVLAVPFSYGLFATAQLLVNYIVFLFTRPRVLPERQDISSGGIPADTTVVFFRPVFAKTIPEMETVLGSMKQDIINNQEPHRNIKFIVIDNTRDEGVKSWTRNHIFKMQEEFGDDVVFYFHRNVQVDFFKKVGILHDAIMLLYDGWTRPRNYQGEQWAQWTKGLRNPGLPTWDFIQGNIEALGIMSPAEDVIAGKDIVLDAKKRMNAFLVCDADNVWPQGSLRKTVAKILNPDNAQYTIYQPSIEISNPKETRFIALNAMAREMYGFDMIARWRVYGFQPFYGKGAMHTENYVRDIILSEWLHPGKAASHDFQESLRANTVLMEDVYIWEKTFSNKLSEITRAAQWSWGDIETVRQFIFTPFSPGRRSHLQALLRLLINDAVFGVWLFGMMAAASIAGPTELINISRILTLFAFTVGITTVFPRMFIPLLNCLKKKPYVLPSPAPFRTDVFSVLWRGIWTTAVSQLIFSLDMVYKPRAVMHNWLQQRKGKPFVWKTGAMSEIEMAHPSVVKAYRQLWISTSAGAVIVILGIAGVIPALALLFLSPYAASFLLGPVAVKMTA